MSDLAVKFVPIDLDADGALCVRFRRDSFVSSFGSDDAFVRDNGEQKYLDWLRARICEFPEGCAYVGTLRSAT